ncbi:hypothetical protein MHYP_G00001010 [Metynnis hypsauchen]
MKIILLTLCVWLCQASAVDLKNCKRPPLRDGFLVPRQDSYEHGTKVSYGCNTGLKPVVETWWGELLCGNGEWSHTPHCVPSSNCIAPVVPHATPKPSQVSYPSKSTVTFVCDKGYEFELEEKQAACENGEWGPLPTCKRKRNACDAPSHVPNALIKQPYRDTFDEGETITYLCKEGYEFKGKDTSTCERSRWDHTPKCEPKVVRPAISHVADCGEYPPIRNGNFDVSAYALTFRCYSRYQLRGPTQVMCLSGQWSEVPVCVAGSDPSRPVPAYVGNCGDLPTIEHGDATKDRDGLALIVRCAQFYKLEGPKEVRCVDNKWTQLPACKAPCRLDQSKFSYRQDEYMQHGEKKWFYCAPLSTVDVKCENGRAFYRGCGDHDW